LPASPRCLACALISSILQKGEVANRILSVGSDARARLLAEYLEPPAPGRSLFMLQSGRGFLTITGRYNGVPVSIVSLLSFMNPQPHLRPMCLIMLCPQYFGNTSESL
jgi:hypothetical protein